MPNDAFVPPCEAVLSHRNGLVYVFSYGASRRVGRGGKLWVCMCFLTVGRCGRAAVENVGVLMNSVGQLPISNLMPNSYTYQLYEATHLVGPGPIRHPIGPDDTKGPVKWMLAIYIVNVSLLSAEAVFCPRSKTLWYEWVNPQWPSIPCFRRKEHECSCELH